MHSELSWIRRDQKTRHSCLSDKRNGHIMRYAINSADNDESADFTLINMCLVSARIISGAEPGETERLETHRG